MGKHKAAPDYVIEDGMKSFCKDWSPEIMSTEEVIQKEFTNEPFSDFKIMLDLTCKYGISTPPSFSSSLPAEFVIRYPNSLQTWQLPDIVENSLPFKEIKIEVDSSVGNYLTFT